MTREIMKFTRLPGSLMLAGFVQAALPVMAQESADYQEALAGLQAQWSTVETYCTSCHNFEDFAGGVDLSFFGPQDVAAEGKTFEMVLRKVRNSVMPPPGQDKPSGKERWDLVASTEGSPLAQLLNMWVVGFGSTFGGVGIYLLELKVG